jgi:glucan phosphoethanolaminetransferase (alkaline phosphatase superfamily)
MDLRHYYDYLLPGTGMDNAGFASAGTVSTTSTSTAFTSSSSLASTCPVCKNSNNMFFVAGVETLGFLGSYLWLWLPLLIFLLLLYIWSRRDEEEMVETAQAPNQLTIPTEPVMPIIVIDKLEEEKDPLVKKK